MSRPKPYTFKVLPGGADARRKGVKRKLARLAAFIAIPLLFVLIPLAWSWLQDIREQRALQTVTAEITAVEEKLPVEGIINRDESIIFAPAAGYLHFTVPEGQRVPVGELVAVLEPEPPQPAALAGTPEEPEQQTFWQQAIAFLRRLVAAGTQEKEEPETADTPPRQQPPASSARIHAPLAGMVAFGVDGYESALAPVGRRFFYLGDRREQEGAMLIADGQFVEKGQPLGRIVNNYHWYFSFVLPAETGARIASLEEAELVFSLAPDRRLQACREEFYIDRLSEEYFITYRVDEELPLFYQTRHVTAEIILDRHAGVLLPVEALVDDEGRTGVYTIVRGRARFQAVEIVYHKDQSSVFVDIPAGTQIILTPEHVCEGQRMY